MSELPCSVESLHIHPVKSCAGIAVQRSLLVETGLDLDRAWMLVDAQGLFVTQRELPRLALVQPALRGDEILLRAPGMLGLHLAVDRAESPRRVQVWDDWVPAWDMGDLAAQWFSDFSGQALRLVRFDPEHRRLSEQRWTVPHTGQTAFADGFALLVVSSASLAELNRRLALLGMAPVDLRRFRPNLVLDGLQPHDEDHVEWLEIDTAQGTARLKLVKPCTRCSIPGVDPDTGTQGFELVDALASYRRDARVDGAATFGMNAIVVDGAGFELQTGQACRAQLAF